MGQFSRTISVRQAVWSSGGAAYDDTAVAKANGATDEEIREAVAMAAITRHWSTVLNGMQVDLPTFKSERDAVLKLAAEKAKKTQ